MAKGDTTYIVETNLDREEIDKIIEDGAASISLFRKDYKGHSYFQIKDGFGRLIGRKRKCFEYSVENNQIVFKAGLGSYTRRTSLDGSYGFLIADEFKHYLSELFLKLSVGNKVTLVDNNEKKKTINIKNLQYNKVTNKAITPGISCVVAIVGFALCPIYGGPGILLLPLGFGLAIRGLHTREGKAMSVVAIVILCVDTFFCIVRILANCGIYLFI